jgi:hypothetical protein
MLLIQVNDVELEVPDILIDKFVSDFEGLPGGKNYEAVCTIRDLIEQVVDMVYSDPEIIDEPEYQDDFVRAMAMQEALKKHGIYYDA